MDREYAGNESVTTGEDSDLDRGDTCVMAVAKDTARNHLQASG